MKVIFSLSLVLCFLISCSEDKESHIHSAQSHDYKEYRDSSTIEMAELLVAHYANMPFLQTNYKNSERAAHFLSQVDSTDVNQEVQASLRGSFELVNAGKNEKAIEVLNKVYSKILKLNFETKNQIIFRILGLRAIAHFRIAELENCRMNHNSASCILPFQPEAYHKLRSGSEKAIEDILVMLKLRRDPNFLYLLNVAYMTLGDYPDKVPEEYLIPLTVEEEETNVGRFINIGSSLGVDDNKLSGGVVIEDFDNDGDMDILGSSWNLRDDLVYYVNEGNGSFREAHVEAGLKGITGGLNMIQGDYNNDGYIDVFVLRGAWLSIGKNPNSLLKNNGNGTFSDVTIESGLFSLHPTQTATWADFNNDGHLDLFVGNESFTGQETNPCELYINSGNHTFANIANAVGANIVGYIKGVASSDIDNDGDQDLFLSNLNNKNILLRNDRSESEHGFTFTDISETAGIQFPLQSFPTWFFDYDNDGKQDLFVASYPVSYYNNLATEYVKELVGNQSKSESPKLYKNLGENIFKDVSSEVGLDKVCFTMGSNFGDFNNDGFLDIYLGTGEPDLKAVIPNRAFLNNSGKKFQEVTGQAGLGHLQKGHAISFADLDNDGDQDIYAVMGGAYEGDVFFNALFENPGHGNSFLYLSLIGSVSNRSAIGAKMKITLDSGQSLHRSVSCGSSFGGNSLSRLEIGVPSGHEINSLEIIWPDGSEQLFDNLEKNSWYTLKEGMPTPQKKKLTVSEFNKEAGHHHHH